MGVLYQAQRPGAARGRRAVFDVEPGVSSSLDRTDSVASSRQGSFSSSIRSLDNLQQTSNAFQPTSPTSVRSHPGMPDPSVIQEICNGVSRTPRMLSGSQSPSRLSTHGGHRSNRPVSIALLPDRSRHVQLLLLCCLTFAAVGQTCHTGCASLCAVSHRLYRGAPISMWVQDIICHRSALQVRVYIHLRTQRWQETPDHRAHQDNNVPSQHQPLHDMVIKQHGRMSPSASLDMHGRYTSVHVLPQLNHLELAVNRAGR